MKKFKGKYEKIIESTITRFEQGGILSGDLVRLRKDYIKNEKVKSMTEQMKAMLEDMASGDLNIRVSAIKSIRPTTTGNYGGGHNAGTRAPTDHWVDIIKEYAPGLWRDVVTVPIEILEVVDTEGNLAPVPDSVKRKSEVSMPKDVESPDADRRTPETNAKPDFENKTTDGRTQIKKASEVKKKNQGKLTLESVYDDMMAPENPEESKASYKIVFGEPFGKNPEAILSKIQGMEGLSNNMDNEWLDDNTLKIKIAGDVDPEKLRDMISNVVKGSVDVAPESEAELTGFGVPAKEKPAVPGAVGKGVVIGGEGPSIGASA